MKKPLFIIGANYGPARTSRFHDLVKDKISVACSCCFRDSYSYNQFKDLTNVHYAPDVLFAFDPYKYIHSMNNHRGLAISVINLSKRPSIKNLSDVYYESIAKLVDSQLHKQIPITLLSFCSNEGDSEAINKVLKLCHESKKVNVVEYKDDFKPLLQAIEMCDTIIATRFHAMVLGWIMNKHVIPIIYSPKQTQVISDINYNGPIFKIENIEGDLEKLIEECGKTRPRINELERIQEMALKQFFDFDEFVLREDI
jgi:colanic acid/amylovoran biosynthesis protein